MEEETFCDIPLFAPNIALGDLVSAEEDHGVLYFDRLIETSGHSTIQLIIFNESEVIEVTRKLEQFGCTWEGGHIPRYIAIDVPNGVDYNAIRSYLDQGEDKARWSYKEACIGYK